MRRTLTHAERASGPQRRPRAGSTALVPGISVRYSETARWAGWEVRASRQEGDRQRLRSWTLRAHDLEAALLEACRWRCEWSRADAQETYRAARRAIPAGVRQQIRTWRSQTV